MDEWLARPDKTVTRVELWDFIRRYEMYRRLNTPLRRLWRWFLHPMVDPKDQLRAEIERVVEKK